MAEPRLAARGVDVALRDGSTLHVRPTRREDWAAIRAFLEGLSDESRWLRFFGAGANLDDAATVAVDDTRAFSLIGVTGPDGRVVAHGIYVPERPGIAEVAFAVADERSSTASAR
jgi:hypothetical protein